MPEGDAAFGQIVGGKFQRDLIARQNADAIAAQASRQMGQDDALVFELHAEQPAGEFLKNRSSNFYAVFFAHKPRSVVRTGAETELAAPVREFD